MASGVATHEHVQRGLRAAIKLMPTLLIAGHAALSGRHNADQAAFDDEPLESLDGPHRAGRIGHHDVDELFGRDVEDRVLRMSVLGARVDEQDVEYS